MEEYAKMDINPILSAECEDCGVSIIISPEFIFMYEINGEFTLFTLCNYCERPIIGPVDRELVESLMERDVKMESLI